MNGLQGRRNLRAIRRMADNMGLGADPGVDKAALDQLHALAVQIAAARAAGNTEQEDALRAQFNNASKVYAGFTASQLDAEIQAAQLANDPLGLKTVSDSVSKALFWGALALGAYLVFLRPAPLARRREW